MKVGLKAGGSLLVLEGVGGAYVDRVDFNSLEPDTPALEQLADSRKHDPPDLRPVVEHLVDGRHRDGLPHYALAQIGNVPIVLSGHVSVVPEGPVPCPIHRIDPEPFHLDALVLLGNVVGRELHFVDLTREGYHILPGQIVALQPDSSLFQFTPLNHQQPLIRSGFLPHPSRDLEQPPAQQPEQPCVGPYRHVPQLLGHQAQLRGHHYNN